MKKQFNKGDHICIWENGQPSQMSCNLDTDRKLAIDDVFIWQNSILFKVISIDYPLTVEEIG